MVVVFQRRPSELSTHLTSTISEGVDLADAVIQKKITTSRQTWQ